MDCDCEVVRRLVEQVPRVRSLFNRSNLRTQKPVKQYEEEVSMKYVWFSNRNRDVRFLGQRTVSDGILSPRRLTTILNSEEGLA